MLDHNEEDIVVKGDFHTIIQKCYSHYLKYTDFVSVSGLLFNELVKYLPLDSVAVAILEPDTNDTDQSDSNKVAAISAFNISDDLVLFELERYRNECKALYSNTDARRFVKVDETEGSSLYLFKLCGHFHTKGLLLMSVKAAAIGEKFLDLLTIIISGVNDIIYHYNTHRERVQLDIELVTNREDLLSALNSLNGTIVIIDHTLTIQNVLGKECHIAGKLVSELVDENIECLGKQIADAVHKVRNSNKPKAIEYVFRDEKVVKWYQLSINILSLKDAQVKIGILITDITRLKTIQKELNKNIKKQKELNSFKSKIISVITHEFGNPLSIVSTSVEMIELHLKSHPELANRLKEKFKIIYNHITLLNEMIRNFRLINRWENKGSLRFSKLFFSDLISELVQDFNKLYQNRLKLRISGKEDIEKVMCADSVLLKQIFINLFNNAIKYSNPLSPIEIDVSFIPIGMKVSVEDKGIGIPEEDLPYIFEPFYRGSNVNTIVGSGLGLDIIKKYVEIHKGQIRIRSLVNQGTKVEIFFPYGC